ncbi:MAG TPA: succinylglutamate desuccinylase/aspartoacylase family protein [Clostridia bacterium]|nr:succinylglutamate desuccinylase/aspartoacylase family protein [Clostridia bacterium]
MGRGIIKAFMVILLTLCFVFAEGNHSTAALMKGTGLETVMHLSDSGKAGPTVVIIGGIHGDETAGVLAAEALTQLMPDSGRIVVVPRANKPACDSGVRTEYYMEDLNRCFPGDRDGSPTKYAAATLVEAITACKPSVVIDLHESRSKYGEEAGSLGQALVISEQGDSAEIVLDILEGLNKKAGAGNEFTFASGAPAGSLNREISKLLRIPAITVETWSEQEMEVRINNHIYAVSEILKYFNMLEK